MKYFLLLSLIFAFACSPSKQVNKNIIRIKGSDTMSILAKNWVESYMISHPNVSIYLEYGGSGAGFNALINDEIDIAISSRLITAIEASQMARQYKSIGISYLVAKDALSIFVNPQNKIKNLTMVDLTLIFSGHIKNWLVFTDYKANIQPVIRPQSSGTHLYFKDHVLKDKEYAPECIRLPSTKDITRYVAIHKNAIGYGGIAFGDSVFTAPINGVYPTIENIMNDSYPLSRYLYLYTVDTPGKNITDFIDWILSPAGQTIVKHTGYIPLWD